jgi:hypothetical protein
LDPDPTKNGSALLPFIRRFFTVQAKRLFKIDFIQLNIIRETSNKKEPVRD